MWRIGYPFAIIKRSFNQNFNSFGLYHYLCKINGKSLPWKTFGTTRFATRFVKYCFAILSYLFILSPIFESWCRLHVDCYVPLVKKICKLQHQSKRSKQIPKSNCVWPGHATITYCILPKRNNNLSLSIYARHILLPMYLVNLRSIIFNIVIIWFHCNRDFANSNAM